MATIRKFLNTVGFDWDHGRIIVQIVEEEWPGWSRSIKGAYYAHVGKAFDSDLAGTTSDILDDGFDDGFGGPMCPRFIAEDNEYIYFPSQYDGATQAEKVAKDITIYLLGNDTPYPGG